MQRIGRLLAVPAAWAIRFRTWVKFCLHIAIFVASYLLAWLIRFDLSVPPQFYSVIEGTLAVMLLGKTVGFLSFGLFRGWWRYASIKDILPIAGGCTLGSMLFLVAAIMLPGPLSVPRSIFLLDWGIMLMMVLAGRYIIRTGRETFGRRGFRREEDRAVLVVGAGAAGQAIAREISENPALGLRAAGFIDDDPRKVGTRIHGVKVLGGHGKIESICRGQGIDEIIVALPSATPSQVRHIVEHCERVSVRFKILPGVGELIDGKVSVKNLRNIDLEDLLGRDPVALDTDLLRRDVAGKVVMVTGAAGSIGSELCRRLALLEPARIVMFEIAESPLFDLDMEMRAKFPAVSCIPEIGDVRDRARVRDVILANRPHVVYHAAAYKHVPMMEAHPGEAVRNNILGTRVVAEASAEFGVSRFVLVSSDKAVRPTNVMGATKRVAELIVQNMNGRGKGTIFVAVRFGNVLGSVGSVIPTFRKQLATTGKLTVTHPDASRYFMLIPEAAGLIVQAGAMGEGGEVFVLEMGEPVRIVDLATELIRLSGRTPGIDAEIVFTGLRPGEKLHEELVIEGEDVQRTSHPKVMKLIGEVPPPADWRVRLDRLIRIAHEGDRREVVQCLDDLVKGYTPDFDFHGLPAPPDPKFIH
ncbi:MAG TPA: nucleoside-diphosphate sugar epimerase/dehydratase [Candidatus Deferrimicrobiaceae bacterium]